MISSLNISILALIISTVALYFSIRKEIYRVRLIHKPDFTRYGSLYDNLLIVNDSSFSIAISDISHVNSNGDIQSIAISDKSTGEYIDFPIVIVEKRKFNGLLIHNNSRFPVGEIYGFIVQLDGGQTYFTGGNLNFRLKIKFKFKSILSCLSAGRFGFKIKTIDLG